MNGSQTTYLTNQLLVDGKQKNIKINHVYCIGYSGRNQEKAWEHIEELAKIGVPKPEEVPALYPVSTYNVTQSDVIEVIGDQTCGEAEIVLVFGDDPNDISLTVGSDHTDRALETVDINKSKQVCAKPFAKKAWQIDQIIDHWDDLILSSETFAEGEWTKYQNNPISSIIDLETIKAYLQNKKVPMTNTLIFCGTVPLQDGFKYGGKFSMTLTDPVRNDSIKKDYSINNLLQQRGV